MKIQLQENNVNLVNFGGTKTENGSLTQNVTFEMKGKTFDLDVLLSPDGDNQEYSDTEDFYVRNKEAVDNSLIKFFSDNHLYNNQ